MAPELEAIFGELGLAQYLDAFVEQGFDEWDIILDIQESDLDVLGVKLGHRRKLQRRIANARGISPSASLVSPVRPAAEDVKPDTPRAEPSRPEGTHEVQGVAKRKYRRHPKPDENAPERPPSAYVLFSNKMREDLKSQNLSFTEIAKLVGENWQNLVPTEKEAYESQANTDKEKYHRDLMEYKKTHEFKKYIQYLQEFKDKQTKQNQASDASKRPKLEPAKLRNGGSSSSNAATPGINTPSGSGSGSGSERFQGSEPPPSRKERMNSITSIAESQHSAAPTMLSQTNSNDDAMSSPRGSHYDTVSPNEPPRYHAQRPPSWREGGRGGEPPHQHLPSLSDMLDDGRKGMSPNPGGEGNPYSSGFVAANHPRLVPEVLNGLPPTTAPRMPLLRHDQSSNSSVGSTSPAMSIARTPGEGSLPIHALLSYQTVSTPGAFDRGPQMAAGATPSPTDLARPQFGHSAGPRGYGSRGVLSTGQLVNAEQSGEGGVLATPAPHFAAKGEDKPARTRLDGVSALLRAGEIVESHDRDERR
ncbi:hypothetical protein G7Z17_g4818 [Cylindrodendrum hubeiense]|uniref:HMG box domain-containing protein n=1 Tax=Cylindrodendrum hubeiense TaxID=595255 RepID=A0A9P5H7Z2_9HYPO|nr:hypothetical protein G7Z17_g4818 [Cylindrodendrum hubeiense]